MIVLAIETSCDDTGIALLEGECSRKTFGCQKLKILQNLLASQVKIHRQYGGVYPTLAKREHQKNLPLLLKKIRFPRKRINALAVTIGPGLEPALWAGVNFAKGLAERWNLPIVPVNHIEGHILSPFLSLKPPFSFSNYLPALALIVSGGHTQLVFLKKGLKYQILGETRDDAAGECFDKTARLLGFPYPGGPFIAKAAKEWRINHKGKSKGKYKIRLPRPMIYQKNYDFSFSGLKTAVLYDFRKRKKKTGKSKEYIGEMAKEIEEAIAQVLIKKTIKAVKDYKTKLVILGGGVSANNFLRKKLKESLEVLGQEIVFLLPEKKFSTDNGAMIALSALFESKKGTRKWETIKAQANLRLRES